MPTKLDCEGPLWSLFSAAFALKRPHPHSVKSVLRFSHYRGSKKFRRVTYFRLCSVIEMVLPDEPEGALQLMPQVRRLLTEHCITLLKGS